MSDIAFLLLIFFLVTTIFAAEKGIPLILPPAKPPSKVKRDNLLVLRTHATGDISLGDRYVPLSAVRSMVESRLASNHRLIVVLETHPESDYGLTIDILDELRLANARRISLQTMNPAQKER